MKTYRVLTVVLLLLVLFLAYLQLFGAKKTEEKTVEMWHTNSVQMWQTNVVEKWCTNVTEVTSTNTVLQPVTNEVVKEVVKEVPAKISAQVRQAATLGYKYQNAPALDDRSGALYKVSPVALDVSIDESARDIVAGDAEIIKNEVQGVLRARNIPTAVQSPYTLRLTVASSWRTEVPRAALLNYRLELKQNVALERQKDLVQSSGTVWSTATSRLTRTFNAGEDARKGMEALLEKFCNDYTAAQQSENAVAARIPALPTDFLPE